MEGTVGLMPAVPSFRPTSKPLRRLVPAEEKDVFFIDNRITILTGHYGSGKTNIAVDLALRAAAREPAVTIVDLDIVNPYFRTADFRAELEAHGIRVIAPIYANSNLDIPALPPEINSIFDGTGRVFIDVGGDDAGAIALGQFARRLQGCGYDLYYVVNERRYLTREPEQAVELLREIEASSRLNATGILNNTNLGADTTAALVRDSLPFAGEVARIAGLPLVGTCIDERLHTPGDGFEPITIHVKNWHS